jgi:hypothetical protein
MLNTVANKPEYLRRLTLVIEHLHNCNATWRETVHVPELLNDQTVWEGDVEVFDLNGNPTSTRAYGWSQREGNGDNGERFVAVLEIPPVDSAQKAVQFQIAKDVKSGHSASL